MTETLDVDEYRKLQARQMNQAELGQNILELVHTLSGLAMHIRSARTSKTYIDSLGKVRESWVTPGEGDIENYPDWTIFLPLQKRCIWAELTKVGKKPSTEQINYGIAILQSGGRWYWWTPADWYSGEIEKILRGYDGF